MRVAPVDTSETTSLDRTNAQVAGAVRVMREVRSWLPGPCCGKGQSQGNTMAMSIPVFLNYSLDAGAELIEVCCAYSSNKPSRGQFGRCAQCAVQRTVSSALGISVSKHGQERLPLPQSGALR